MRNRLLKYSLCFFVSVLLSLSTFAKGGDVKQTFFTTVIDYYSKQLVKVHALNVKFIELGYFDSLRTNLNVDLSNWQYNEKDQTWAPASPSSAMVNFNANHYYYKYDKLTNANESNLNHPSTNVMGDYNQAHPQTSGQVHLLYNVEIVNLPLLLVKRANPIMEPDTNLSMVTTLKELEYTNDEMYERMMAMNNAIGKEISGALNAFRVSQPDVEYVLVFNTFSEPVNINGKQTGVRFYNFYKSEYANTELCLTLKRCLKKFHGRKDFQTKDVLTSFVATMKCELDNNCEDVSESFKTDEAKDFWARFTIAAPLRTETYFNEHKLRAIEIATVIDGMADRDLAVELDSMGLCYLDEYYCDPANTQSSENVCIASAIALKYFQSSIFTPVSNQGEVTAAILANTTNIKFKVLQLGGATETEIEFEFSSAQSKESLVKALTELGLTYKRSYRYWLFCTDKADTYGNYFYWLDHEYNKTPPMGLVIFAGFLTGPASAVYGWCTGTDMITGAELSGLDYVLNVFDLIPAVGILGDLGSGFFKSVKITRLGKTFTLAGETTVMYKAYHKAVNVFKTSSTTVKNTVYKCMSWGINATFNEIEKVLVLMDKTGNEIGKMFPNKLELKSNQILTTPGGQTFPVKGDVFVDGQKSTSSYELVKKEDGNFGVRVASEVGAFGKYSTRIDDKVEVLQKESLFGNDAATFLDVEYRTVKTTQPVITYRSFGGDARVGGSFVTSVKDATRSELALLDEWNNNMRFEATINIPTNTKINIGKVGPQTSNNGLQTLPGGEDQMILPFQWDKEWVTKIMDKTTGKVYNSVSEFGIDFPDLVN